MRTSIRRRTASMRLLGLLLVLVCCSEGRADDPEEAPPEPQRRAELSDTQQVLFLADTGPVLFELRLTLDGRSHREMWDRFVRETFQALDRNQDGVLTDKEPQGIPTTQQLAQLGIAAAGTAKRPKENVTLEQLFDYLGKISGGPFHVSATTPGSGTPRFGGPAPAGGEGRLFDRLDTDQDGFLSREELTLNPALRQSDLDDDEVLTESELQPSFSFAYYASAPSGATTEQKSFIRVTPEDLGSLVPRFIERYDRQPPLDQKLSSQELKLSGSVFAVADADSDEQLDMNELRQLLEKLPATIVVTVRLGDDARLPRVSLEFQGAKEIAGMTLTEAANGAYVVAIGKEQVRFSAPAAGANFSDGFEMAYKQQFDAADADNNEYLDKRELRNYPIFGRSTTGLDRDGDGKVFENELLAYVRQTAGVAKNRTMFSVVDEGRRMFELVDQNHDGRISQGELVGVGNRLADWDDDSDQRLANHEVPRIWQVEVSQGLQQRFGPFAVSADSTRTPRPATADSTPNWFHRMDRNNDGDVSRREFLGTTQQFEKFDANGDGFLDPREAVQIGS